MSLWRVRCSISLLCAFATVIVGALSNDCPWKLDRCVHKSALEGRCAAELSRKCSNEKKTINDVKQWCNYLCKERWQWSAWGSWTQNDCVMERRRQCVPPKSGKEYVMCPDGETEETKRIQECIPTDTLSTDYEDDADTSTTLDVGLIIGVVIAVVFIIALGVGIQVYRCVTVSELSDRRSAAAISASRPQFIQPYASGMNQSNFNPPVGPPYASGMNQSNFNSPVGPPYASGMNQSNFNPPVGPPYAYGMNQSNFNPSVDPLVVKTYPPDPSSPSEDPAALPMTSNTLVSSSSPDKGSPPKYEDVIS